MKILLKLICVALIGLCGTTVINSMMDAKSDTENTILAEWTKEQHATFRANCHDKFKTKNNEVSGEAGRSNMNTEKYCDCMASTMQRNDYQPNELIKASKELYSEVSFCILSTITE